MIPFEDRIELVRSCKYVDAAVPQYDMDKLTACKKLGATYLFVGDDWYGTEKWKKYDKDFAKEGIKIIYFPYTKGISSTKIQAALDAVRKDDFSVDIFNSMYQNSLVIWNGSNVFVMSALIEILVSILDISECHI